MTVPSSSMIVPLPGSHQWANARALARLGAIEIADQAALDGARLAERVLSLLDDEPRREALLRAIRRVETEPSLLGASPHFLAIGHRSGLG